MSDDFVRAFSACNTYHRAHIRAWLVGESYASRHDESFRVDFGNSDSCRKADFDTDNNGDSKLWYGRCVAHRHHNWFADDKSLDSCPDSITIKAS